MAKKGNRVQVILECTGAQKKQVWLECLDTSPQKKKNTTERLELKSTIRFLRNIQFTKKSSNL